MTYVSLSFPQEPENLTIMQRGNPSTLEMSTMSLRRYLAVSGQTCSKIGRCLPLAEVARTSAEAMQA